MAEKKKGIGNTLLGLFVVRPEDEAAEESASEAPRSSAGAPAAKAGGDATDDLIARYASGGGSAARSTGARPAARQTGSMAAVSASASAGAATAATARAPEPAAVEPTVPGDVPAVQLDFPGILRRAGLGDEEQGRVDKALTLLHNLPAETPTEIKRQIVGASLQAFGIPVNQIIESAVLHQHALDKHIKEGQTQTQVLLEQSNRRLAELEQEVGRVKQVMQEQLAQQQGLTVACTMQKRRAQEVLDFFGAEAVDRVTQTSVKLRDKLSDA